MAVASIKKNTFYNAIKTVSAIIFPLITFPYISRVLQVENVGKINFGASIVSYFSLIASLGISTYAIRECSKVSDNNEKLSRIASEVYSINIVTTCISYMLLIITLIFWKQIEGYKILILIQSLSIFFTTIGTDWINTAMEDFKYITIRTLLFQLISLCLMLAFVHKPQDYYIYALINVISNSGVNILNIIYRKKYCNIHFTINCNFRAHIAPIIYMFVMLLAQNIFHNVDTTMIGIFRSDFDVGIYSSAYKIYIIISQLVASILWIIMPRMSYFFSKNDYDSINNLVSKIFAFNMLFGLPALIGMCMLSKEFVLIACGIRYVNANVVLKIFSISFFFDLIGGMLLGNALLLPSGREKYYMFSCCVCALLNFILNLILIPYFGVYGAACATAISYVFLFVLLFIKKDKKVKFLRIKESLFGPVIGSFVVFIVCLVCKNITSLYLRTSTSIVISTFCYFLIQLIAKNSIVIDIYNSIASKVRSII